MVVLTTNYTCRLIKTSMQGQSAQNAPVHKPCGHYHLLMPGVVILHILAIRPDSCNLELRPSPIRMWQNPISCIHNATFKGKMTQVHKIRLYWGCRWPDAGPSTSFLYWRHIEWKLLVNKAYGRIMWNIPPSNSVSRTRKTRHCSPPFSLLCIAAMEHSRISNHSRFHILLNPLPNCKTSIRGS